MKKRITIKDIAELASVSETTVSRFLNKKFEYMSEATREKIEKVVEEVGYRPSNIARSLKSNRSNLFGAVIADIENPFSSLIIEGLTNRADELDYTLMISVTNNSIEKEQEAIHTFLDNRVDGLIIQPVSSKGIHLKEVSQSIPIVLIDRDVENFDADIVTTNNYEVGSQLMTHLKEVGFQTIGFVSEEIKENSVRESRYQAFKDNVEAERDLTHVTYIIDRKNTNDIEGKLKEFMTLPKPRVIVASNGLVQITLLDILRKNNYELNKDFYFSGFDNYKWSTMFGEKGITAIAQNSYQLGAEAVNLLFECVNDKDIKRKPVNKELVSELIIRDTERIK